MNSRGEKLPISGRMNDVRDVPEAFELVKGKPKIFLRARRCVMRTTGRGQLLAERRVLSTGKYVHVNLWDA